MNLRNLDSATLWRLLDDKATSEAQRKLIQVELIWRESIA